MAVRARSPTDVRHWFPGLLSCALLLPSLSLVSCDALLKSPERRAVSRAVAFLGQAMEREDLDVQVSLMLAALSHRFPSGGLHRFKAPALENLGRPDDPRLSTDDSRVLAAFGRLIDERHVWKRDDLPHSIDRITSAALHCKEAGVPEDYEGQLRESAAEGGYPLTHALLAIQWLRERACTTEFDENSLASAFADRIAQEIRKSGVGSDLSYEGIAILHYAGHGSFVENEWINMIVSQQHESGSWADTDAGAHRAQHITTVALWALLEGLYGEDAGPMIVNPAGGVGAGSIKDD